jgi:hypothetical protein
VCAISERGAPGPIDVVTPYGFGGFVGTGPGPRFLDDWRAFARERNYVCGFLGLNPVLGLDGCRASTDYVEHQDVYVLDLDLGAHTLWNALSRNRRREIQAFPPAGERLVHDRVRLMAYFESNIGTFLREKGAGGTYSFTAETWRALLEHDDLVLLGVEGPGGDVTAACLFAYTAHCAEAMFTISSPLGPSHAAVLMWAGAAKLAERGIPRLNMGGGVRRDDGVAVFKQRFGARRVGLGALRQVYRPETFAELCRQAGVQAHDRSAYFPPYRAPGAQVVPPP